MTRKSIPALALVVLFAAGLGLVACEEDIPSTSKAVGDFYEAGCVITLDSTELTQVEAVVWLEAVADEYSCGKEHKKLRKCLAGTDFADCSHCNSQFTDLNVCMLGY